MCREGKKILLPFTKIFLKFKGTVASVQKSVLYIPPGYSDKPSEPVQLCLRT